MLIGFLSACVVFGYLLFRLFFNQPEPEPDNNAPATTGNTGQLPDSGVSDFKPDADDPGQSETNSDYLPQNAASDVALGGLTKNQEISGNPGLGATLGKNGADFQYYDKSEGKFYRIDKNGELSALTDKTFFNVKNITWAKSKNKAILEYPDGANILYDFDSNRQITLPTHWKEFDFAPNSDKIVMKSIGLDPENRWLAVASADGSEVRPLESLGDKDSTVYPSWSPNNQIAAMFVESRDFDRQELYFVGLNKENFKSTIIQGRGFQSKWSPRGEQLLYSAYSSDNDLKPDLWLVNSSGDEIGSGRKKLNLETWANKCSYAGESNLYCAVPESMPEGAGLFPELADNIKDVLYKIDTKTGVKKIIAIPEGDFTISEIVVSEDESNLFFTDKASGRIRKIKLK